MGFNDKSDALAPILKWAGGKRWLASHIADIWSREGGRLVEPFAGGLAVSLHAAPAGALINDVNPHLINFYRQIQRGLKIKKRFKNERAYFDAARQRFNRLIEMGETSCPEAAELFYFLSKTSFNGLVRFNSTGMFNTPFGQHKSITYRRQFPEYQALFAGWQFYSRDFLEMPVRAGDFIYADPPYDDTFTNYSAGGFDWERQRDLVEWLAAHQGPVVASNSATPRIVKMYREYGFVVSRVSVRRSIAANGGRAPGKEIVAYRNIRRRPQLRSGSKHRKI